LRNIIKKGSISILLLFVFIFGSSLVSSQFFDGTAPSCSGAAPCAPGTPVGVNTTDNDLVIGDNSVETFNFTIWWNQSSTLNITSINFSFVKGNITLNYSHAKLGGGGTNGSAVFNNTFGSGNYTPWICSNLSLGINLGAGVNSAGGNDYFCRAANMSGNTHAIGFGSAGEHWRPTNISAFWFVVRSANKTDGELLGNATETPGNIVINITVNVTASIDTSFGINSTVVRLTLDTMPPRINLTSPLNETWTKSRTVNFSYIPTDNFLKNCSLVGDFSSPGGFKTNLTVSSTGDGTAFGRNANDGVVNGNGSVNNITAINLPDNYTGYTWAIACYDRVHHLNYTRDNYTLYVDGTAPTGMTATSSEGTSLQNGQISTLTCNSVESNPSTTRVSVSGVTAPLKTCASTSLCSTPYTFDGTGTKTVTCYTQDKAGNSVTKTLSIEVVSAASATESSVSSGGSGGSGSSSSIAVNTQEPNQEVKYTVNNNAIGVSEVKFTPDGAVSNAKLTVSSLAAPAAGVSTPDVTVYKYFEVNKVNFGDANVKKAELTFTVSNTWLTEHGMSRDQVVLMKHTNNNWEQLPTSYVKEQSGYQYYTAQSAGFSLFAIGTKKVEGTTTETTEEQTTEPATSGTTKEKTNVMPFVLVLVVLILIAGIVYFVLNRKNR